MKTIVRRYLFLFLSLALAIVLSGCIGLGGGGTETPVRFYVLRAEAAAPSDAVLGGMQIGINRVEIPDYLGSSRLVTATGTTRVQFADYHRWAENLDVAIARVVYAHLDAAGAEADVMPFGRDDNLTAFLGITIHRFEAREGGNVVLEAAWRLRDQAGELLHRGDFADSRNAVWSSSDYSEMVETMSLLIAEMCKEIVFALDS